MAFMNLASSALGTSGIGAGTNMGINVTNTPGYGISNAPISYQENLGDLTPDQRKSYYQAGDYSQLPSIMQQSGITLGAITNDYNTMFGTNLNTVDVAMMVYGIDAPTLSNWLRTANPNDIANISNQLGITSDDLASWYTGYTGQTITPDQVTGYLTKGPQTSTNLIQGLLSAQGPSSSSSSSNQSSSFSGMDWSKSPVSFDQLQKEAANLPNLADQYSKTIYDRYSKMMRDALSDKGNFTGVLNNIGSRNLAGSTVESDSIGNARMGIAKDIGDKAYASDMAGMNAKMAVPGTLAQIAGLGQVSTSQSSGGSGSTSSSGNLQNYALLADMLAGSMFA